MTTLKPQRAPGETLAAWAWAAVALTPVGWFSGALAVAYSHLGDVVDVNQEITGFLLFVTAPTSAFILAVHAARAGHRSGKIAVIVAGLLLLATIVLTLLYGGWIGLAVVAMVVVLVLAWVRSQRIAVVASGLLLLAILLFSAWLYGGWINVAVIAVMAVVVVLVLAWAHSRNKPPPAPDGAPGEGGSPAATAPPGASGRTGEFTKPGPHQALPPHVPPARPGISAHDLIIAAHAAETGRTILSRDAKTRFGELPGVSAIGA